MTLSDPVGAGEIAQRAGVVKATVWSWQKRHSDFPAPVQLEMGPVWDWAEVEAWLRPRRRPAPQQNPETDTYAESPLGGSWS